MLHLIIWLNYAYTNVMLVLAQIYIFLINRRTCMRVKILLRTVEEREVAFLLKWWLTRCLFSVICNLNSISLIFVFFFVINNRHAIAIVSLYLTLDPGCLVFHLFLDGYPLLLMCQFTHHWCCFTTLFYVIFVPIFIFKYVPTSSLFVHNKKTKSYSLYWLIYYSDNPESSVFIYLSYWYLFLCIVKQYIQTQ